MHLRKTKKPQAAKIPTSEQLVSSGEALAPEIFLVGVSTANTIFDEETRNKIVSNNQMNQAVLYCLSLWLVFIDKKAFLWLGDERRNIFMDAVYTKVFAEYFEKTGISDKKTIEATNKTFNEVAQELSAYKQDFAENDAPPKDTLFWEFGKKVCMDMGIDSEIMYAEFALVEAFGVWIEDLDLKRRFDELIT